MEIQELIEKKKKEIVVLQWLRELQEDTDK